MADSTSTAPNLVEQRLEERSLRPSAPNPFLELGDVSGFVWNVVLYGVAVLAIGYVGATVVNITNLSGSEIDALFPTDLENFPYHAPIGRINPSGDSIGMLFSDFSANQDVEHLTMATLEFIFPMKRQSFPYTSWFLSREFRGTISHNIAQWFASTCAGTFCFWRKMYKVLIVLGKWFHTVAYTISDFVLFYIFPYVVFYLVLLPVIPFFGAAIAFMASTMYNIPGAYILTFAPFMGFIIAIANVFTAPFNFFSYVMSALIFFAGFFFGWVNIAWWFMIGGAVWLYTIMFLFLSPLLHKGGMQNVVDEFKRHKKSLLFFFTILVVIAAFTNLSIMLTTGICLGALVCFYLIYKLPAAEKA
jgi:hypothetical protein